MNERDQDFTVETKIMTLSIHAYNLLAPNWMAGAHFRFDIRLFFCFITWNYDMLTRDIHLIRDERQTCRNEIGDIFASVN